MGVGFQRQKIECRDSDHADMSDGCEGDVQNLGALAIVYGKRRGVRSEEASHGLGEAETIPPSRRGGRASRVGNTGGGSKFSLHQAELGILYGSSDGNVLDLLVSVSEKCTFQSHQHIW